MGAAACAKRYMGLFLPVPPTARWGRPIGISLNAFTFPILKSLIVFRLAVAWRLVWVLAICYDLHAVIA
jgi:hypothetical protein